MLKLQMRAINKARLAHEASQKDLAKKAQIATVQGNTQTKNKQELLTKR